MFSIWETNQSPLQLFPLMGLGFWETDLIRRRSTPSFPGSAFCGAPGSGPVPDSTFQMERRYGDAQFCCELSNGAAGRKCVPAVASSSFVEGRYGWSQLNLFEGYFSKGRSSSPDLLDHLTHWIRQARRDSAGHLKELRWFELRWHRQAFVD